MRPAIYILGIASLLAGILQLIFAMWAGEASWHLGSPMRLRGDISRYFEGHARQSLIESQYRVGLRVIDTLSTSIDVHFISGVLLVVLGISIICIGFKLRRSSAGG